MFESSHLILVSPIAVVRLSAVSLGLFVAIAKSPM
jgi:hypothetical protein